jgi:hypothetical protein
MIIGCGTNIASRYCLPISLGAKIVITSFSHLKAQKKSSKTWMQIEVHN